MNLKSLSFARAKDALETPVDIAWLAAFRVLFGLVMCFSTIRFISYGWIERSFVEPAFHFKYWGFGWVPAPGLIAGYAIFVVLTVLAVALTVGAWFRITCPLFALLFIYVQLIDVTTYLNHYYLAGLLACLLAVSPAHKAWSVDAYRAKSQVSFVARPWLWLFRFQVAVVYTFAGVAKAQPDWLLSSQPLGIWLSSLTDLLILGRFFSWDWAAPIMSWSGFLFDSTIVGWMSWHRTRPYAYTAIIVFHSLTRALFPIGLFPVIMMLAALVFFSPDWPRRLASRVYPVVLAPRGVSHKTDSWRRWQIASAVLFAIIQVLLPLRHLAYGGNVLWDEQGMRFSWRVMVREKNGSLTYSVKQKSSQRVFDMSPRKYLNPIQEKEMVGQPDLILQLAHHIERDLGRRGFGLLEIRASAFVSLNGRPGAYLIDPTVDLARVRDGLGRADWIHPSPNGAIPRTHSIPHRVQPASLRTYTTSDLPP